MWFCGGYNFEIIALFQCLTLWLCQVQFSSAVYTDYTPFLRPKKLSDFKPGINIYPEECFTAEQTQSLERSIYDARFFIKEALKVMDFKGPLDKPLFNFFFDDADRELVTTAFRSALDILSNKNRFPVVIRCKDVWGDCGYSVGVVKSTDVMNHKDSLAPIVICAEKWFAHQDRPDACEINSLLQQAANSGRSQAGNLLHEVLHVDNVAGPDIKSISDAPHLGAPAAHIYKSKWDHDNEMTAEEVAAWKPTNNADSFMSFAVWSWMRQRQRRLCPENYPLWNMVAELGEQDRAKERNENLRHLLGDESSQEEYETTTNTNSHKDFSNCDEACLNYLAQNQGCASNGTVPTNECYPPVLVSAATAPTAWGTYTQALLPSDYINPDGFTPSDCPSAIDALCTVISLPSSSLKDVWIMAPGSSLNCVAGLRQPSPNAIRGPTTDECQATFAQMTGVLDSTRTETWRVGVNLLQWPTMTNLKSYQPAVAGPVLNRGGTNGWAVDVTVPSFILRAYG